MVSAVDGAVLFQKNLTATHTYSVWADPVTHLPWPGPQGPGGTPHPSGVNNTWFPTPSSLQVVTLEHADLSTNDPWLPPGATQTLGNNVQAYADLGWPSGYNASTDLLGVTTSPDTFGYTYDFNAPESPLQVKAGVVSLFYVTNFLHDWYYDDGFDEAARNAQAQNFARGGAGNDALLAEAADSSWTNNADMTTPADGRSPRMQMYVFYGPWSTHDGTIDNGVVAHEWGHFISNRLIGDGNGLSTLQADGMGEGWGDFHAALLITRESRRAGACQRQLAGQLVPLGLGVRHAAGRAGLLLRLPPLPAVGGLDAKNPLTFKHIADGTPLPTNVPICALPGASGADNSEVHNTGEVWAAMLWDCYVALLRDPRFTFEQARTRMKRYLVAAYKATPLTAHLRRGARRAAVGRRGERPDRLRRVLGGLRAARAGHQARWRRAATTRTTRRWWRTSRWGTRRRSSTSASTTRP